jgi:hypothetical protein
MIAATKLMIVALIRSGARRGTADKRNRTLRANDVFEAGSVLQVQGCTDGVRAESGYRACGAGRRQTRL